ncbi:hypothetical protein FSP39_019209 [Pinctada imbricata]|uniref:B box-type domain-containing protein n=1 Tax=Pinctada imbricata TaxID=66713 RepID=A0AA88YFF9_PINIB|nr:hypothetical protein FSP39_019209 [Pinctada imbricata]
MAFASTRKGAHDAVIKSCDLCEDEENVNWFCKDCDQKLCDRCKKTHLRTATCKHHRLVPILEGVPIQKANVSYLCEEHNKQFLFFCRTCNEIICPVCLSMFHRKHNVTDFRNLQSELQRKLESAIKVKEDEVMQITMDIVDLEKCVNQSRDTLTERCTIIDDRVNAINSAVREQGQKLKESLKTATDKQIKEVEGQKEKLEGRKHEYDETIQTIRQEITLQSVTTLNPFVETSIYTKLHSLKPMTCSIPVQDRFSIGRTNEDLISEMIGKIDSQLDTRESNHDFKKIDIRYSKFLSTLHIVDTHKLDLKTDCCSICASPDGSIWIGGVGFVYKVSSDCSTILHQIPARESLRSCYYIACLQSGDAVVSASGFDRFTSDGRRIEITNLSPRFTFDIAVTEYDDIAVSYRSLFLSPIKSILLFSKEGRQLHNIHSEDSIDSFCLNKDGKYVICTSVREIFGNAKDNSSCLTTLNDSGTVLDKIHNFKPTLRRMICDRYGNILGLPGHLGKEVYIISDNGELEERKVRSFTVECDSITDICIDRDNRLLILMDKKLIVAKYLE